MIYTPLNLNSPESLRTQSGEVLQRVSEIGAAVTGLDHSLDQIIPKSVEQPIAVVPLSKAVEVEITPETALSAEPSTNNAEAAVERAYREAA